MRTPSADVTADPMAGEGEATDFNPDACNDGKWRGLAIARPSPRFVKMAVE